MAVEQLGTQSPRLRDSIYCLCCDDAQRAAERSYPTSEVRGRSREDPAPEGRQLRVPGCNSTGAAKRNYTHPRPGMAARRSNPTPKEQWLHERWRA